MTMTFAAHTSHGFARHTGLRTLWVLVLLVAAAAAWAAKPVHLEATYFYDGDMSPYSWSPPSIDVDSDGTVAVAINRRVGAGNAPANEFNACIILLYDAKGEPIGQMFDHPAGMVDITFGPDHRIYTAESWFATGTHIFDRPGCANRFVPVRFFRGDGGNVDKGGAQSVAVGPDYRMWDYSAYDKKIHVLSPEDKQLLTLDPPAGVGPRIDIAPDGTVFMSNKVLQKDNTWAAFKYSVTDIRSDGKLLVRLPGGKMGRYDRATDTLEAEYVLPAGDWADQALGPDNNIYLVPGGGRNNGRDTGLAYVVVGPDGKVLLQRGGDFDRLAVELPDDTLTSGSAVPVSASTISSRLLGYVPQANILPNDNHPTLNLQAWLAPVAGDPLVDPVWTPVPLVAKDIVGTPANGMQPWNLALPAGLYGRYRLRFTAGPVQPGLATLQVASDVTLKPQGAVALLTPATDRKRTGFPPGEAVRIAVAVDAEQAVDLREAKLALKLGDVTVWQAPLGLGAVPAGGHATGVAVVPAAVTRVLKPGVYLAVAVGLPVGAGSGQAVVAITDPQFKSDFITCVHSQMGGGSTRVADAKLHAEMGFRDVVLPMQNSAGDFETYLDVASRLGMMARYQPYLHFAALNSLPEEQGAMQQFFAATAQRYSAYPAFAGINYHDLWAPFTTWWDNVRTEREKADLTARVATLPLPAALDGATKETYLTNVARSEVLPRDYAAWRAAIRKVDPRLQVSSQQWWHLDWTYNDPDKATAGMDIIATHHMEEQYYHPATIISQIEDWRRPGVPTFAYGNCDWQEDGTGGQDYRDLMTALSRGVQGAGRNELAVAGNVWAERLHRGVIPALKLSQLYGGISAASQPEDTVAVWRSFYEEAAVPAKPYSYNSAWWQMSAALTTCYYAHHTAGVVTDDKVRMGLLAGYKAVIVSLPKALPPDLLKPLQAFQAHGGLVYANRLDDSYVLPAGAIDLGNLFTRSHADPNCNDDLVRWRDMQDDEGGRLATRLNAIMGDKVRPLADCDDPATWLSVLRAGQCRYVCAVNLHLLPQPWGDLHRYIGYENSTFPAVTPVRLHLPVGPAPAIYDVFNGRPVTPRKDGADWLVDADMRLFPGAILALLPRPIAAVVLGGGQSADHARLHVLAKVVDAKGTPIDGAIPLHVVLTDPAGTVRYDLDRTAHGGVWEQELALAANDPAGTWTLTVQELFGGHQLEAKLKLIAPALPALTPATQAVEWTRLPQAVAALKNAKRIALIVAKAQQATCQPAVDAAQAALDRADRQVVQLTAEAYLADRATYGWDKFKVGSYEPTTRLRPKQFDLIVVFETPAQASKVVAPELLAVKPTATDPGPGRALIQFVTMPVFDTEDGLAVQAGDVAGLLQAATALRQPPAVVAAPAAKPTPLAALPGTASTPPLRGLRQVVGIPVGQVAATPDGQRIAVALKGWGNNLFVLDAGGTVLGGDVAGKFFPLDVVAVPDGFWLTSYENDPTCAYWKHYDRAGKATLRLAADGRRFGGARDWSADHPIVERERFRPQASFSVTADGRFAAVGGSRGIAVWDLQTQKVLWRDDTVHHTVPLSQKADVAPNASMFPQVMLSPDGKGMVLQHGGKILLRDGQQGQALGEQTLPQGATLGRTQLFDGHTLVVGESEFFAFRDGRPLWHWKAPTDVNATAFAADGLHFTIGEPNGTVRILEGAGQIGGYVAPTGGIDSLAILPDATKVAFSTSGGQIGVLDRTGQVLWQANVGSRAQIAFLGTTGETVVGDWQGQISRFSAEGRQVWAVDLTPRVYRDDAAAVLTTPDPTPTLRVPPPADAIVLPVPDAARKLPVKGITYVATGGWRGAVQITRQPALLVDGKTDAQPLPWFTSGYGNFTAQTCRDGAYWLAGAPAAPAFDLQLAQPTLIDTVVVDEDPAHPDAVPQEIKIEAWVNDNWQLVVHDLWVTGTTHVHRFPAVTTNKLRYTVMGDLYRNLWTTEISVYKAP